MKDYFDLWVLARHSDFEGEVLRLLPLDLLLRISGKGFSQAERHDRRDIGASA